MQEHIDLHSSSANEESSDETNPLIIPFEGALRQKDDKRAMECELECGGKCAQKPFGSPKFPQDLHGATQPSHNGLGPNGNWFGCAGIYLEWGFHQAHHQGKIV
jgi:hypothetical protein